MALPTIDTPTYEIFLTSLDKNIKYRPFLVKEEKILLMAIESNNEKEMYDAMKTILKNCILEKVIDVESLPIFDVQFLFLQLRAKSVGEVAEVTLKHPNGENKKGEKCDGIQPISINLNEIKPIVPENHSKTIRLSEKIGVSMMYPTLEFFKKLDDMQTQEKGVVESLFDSIANSIEYIYQGEEIFYANEHSREELLDFLNSLNNAQFEELRNFFSSMPSIQHKETYTCPKCGSQEELTLSTVEDFFA